MGLALKALRVELVEVFGAARAGGKPTVCRDNLQAADRLVVAGGIHQLRGDEFARQFLGRNAFWCELLETCLLFPCARSVDACIERRAVPLGKSDVVSASPNSGVRCNFRCKQAEQESILLRHPR